MVTHSHEHDRPRITPRRREVLDHLAAGLENREIAHKLGVSEQAVKEHVSTLLNEFAVQNRTALAEAWSRIRILGRADVDSGTLAYLFARSPVAIAVLRGPRHVYELANEAYLRTSGRTDLVGRAFREVFPELIGTPSEQRVNLVYERGVTIVEHGVAISWLREGEPSSGFFDLVMQPIVDEAGSVSGIIYHGVDVTEHVLAKRQTEAMLTRFAAGETSDAEVLIIDADGRPVFVTQLLHRYLPLDARRPFAEQMLELGTSIDPSTGQVLGADQLPISRALGGEFVEAARLLVAIKGRHDMTRELIISARPLHDPQGRISGALAIYRAT